MARAKQLTDANTVIQSEIPTPPETPAFKTVTDSEKTTPKKGKTSGTTPVAEPSGLVLDVLRAFPRYKTLYVDRHGGTFSPDTPPVIRAGAVLYRNPFYKS